MSRRLVEHGMTQLRPLTIFLAGVASGLVSSGVVSIVLDGRFGFFYASAGGLLLVVAAALLLRDLRPDDPTPPA